MTFHSVIHNFTNIDTQEAEKLREQLSLSMPTAMLKFCAAYYRESHLRDPFADELKMLDMLVCARERGGSSLAITELFTNDAFVARTHADLLKKHALLHPDLTHPITLSEAANTANEYLAHKRKEKSNLKAYVSIEKADSNEDAGTDTSAVSARSPYRLRFLPFVKSAKKDANLLVLICPGKGDTQNQFMTKLSALLQKQEIAKMVGSIAKIGKGGILEEILRMASGAEILLPALSIDQKPAFATSVFSFSGCYLLRTAPKHWNAVSRFLNEGGVRAIPFASLTEEEKMVFVRGKLSKFAIDTQLLRHLNSYSTTCAKLPDERVYPTPPSYLDGLLNLLRSSFKFEKEMQLGEVTQTGAYTSVAAFAAPAKAYCKTAVYSLLAPTAALCACGVPLRKQELAVTLEIPQDLSDEDTVGKCMATVLGLYRAQMALGLTTREQILVRKNKYAPVPSVFSWSMAENAKKLPTTFAKDGSSVYALTPTLNTDGLPDFSAWKKNLKYITKLAKKGDIHSYRVLFGETLTEGVWQMSNSLVCVRGDETPLSERKLPLCILIESGKKLPLLCVGQVRLLESL
jgi:hypothetical protein